MIRRASVNTAIPPTFARNTGRARMEDFTATGIETIGDAPWGTHLCQLFRSKEDLADFLAPCAKAGIENGELCVVIAAEPLGIEDVKGMLQKDINNLPTRPEDGRVEIVDGTAWFAGSGAFRPDEALRRCL